MSTPSSTSPDATTPSAEPAGHGTAPTAPAGDARSGRGGGLAILVVCLVALGIYLPSLDYDLVYDDHFLIVRNENMMAALDDFGAAFNLFTVEYWMGVNPDLPEALRTRGQALYRPLSLFLWACIANFNGDFQPTWPYHLLNILFNIWVVYLLFRVVQRLFDSNRMATVAALLFAAHPLHSEAVAYVAGVSDIISTGTVLLGLLMFLKATDRPTGVRAGPFVGMLLALFVGLLAKEQGVLVIAVIALTDLMLSMTGRGIAMGQRIAVYAGLVGTLVAHVFVRFAAVGYLKPNTDLISRLDNPLVKEAMDIRVLNAFKLLAKYLWLVLWPKDLSVDYSFNAIQVSRSWTSPEPFAGLLVIGVIVVVALIKLRSAPALSWGLLFFVGCATFTSNMLVPIGTIFAERLMYLPTVGACVAIAFLLDRMMAIGQAGRSGMHPVGLLVAFLAVGALGMRTWERNKDFENSVALFESATEVVPESARVHFQLGSIYANNRLFSKAVEQFDAALADDPAFFPAAIKLGDTYQADLNFDKAIDVYNRIIGGLGEALSDPAQLAAVRSDVYTKRGEAKRLKGDFEGAQEDLDQAMALGVGRTGTEIQLARLMQAQDRWDESIPVLQQALAFEPDNVELLEMKAKAAVSVGDEAVYEETLQELKDSTDEGRAYAAAMEAEVLFTKAMNNIEGVTLEQAMDRFDEAIAFDESLATPYLFRGLYMIQKRGPAAYEDAVAEYDKAIARDPAHDHALLYKARALLDLDRNEEALQTLLRLEQLSQEAPVYALIAEAHFRLGNIEDMELAHAKLVEMGREPVKLIMNRATAYEQRGELDRALEILNQGMVIPEYSNSPELLKYLGQLLLKQGRYDEALATFDQQEAAYTLLPDVPSDPFVPINRTRALMALDRDVEAAGELERAEIALVDADQESFFYRNLRASVLHRRAELFLKEGSSFYNAKEAVDLCTEGMDLTGRRHPPFFDLSIEALVAIGDLPDAAARASEGAGQFPALPRYQVISEALLKAIDGDRQAAVAELTAADDDVTKQIAAALNG